MDTFITPTDSGTIYPYQTPKGSAAIGFCGLIANLAIVRLYADETTYQRKDGSVDVLPEFESLYATLSSSPDIAGCFVVDPHKHFEDLYANEFRFYKTPYTSQEKPEKRPCYLEVVKFETPPNSQVNKAGFMAQFGKFIHDLEAWIFNNFKSENGHIVNPKLYLVFDGRSEAVFDNDFQFLTSITGKSHRWPVGGSPEVILDGEPGIYMDVKLDDDSINQFKSYLIRICAMLWMLRQPDVQSSYFLQNSIDLVEDQGGYLSGYVAALATLEQLRFQLTHVLTAYYA